MKQDNQMSRREFMTMVTVLSGGLLTSCGSDSGDGDTTVSVPVLDTTNTQQFVADIQRVLSTQQLSPELQQILQATQTIFTPAQLTRLEQVMQTLNDNDQGQAFIQQSYDPVSRKFVYPSDLQEILDIAQEKFLDLPYHGGLPRVVNNPVTSSGAPSATARAPGTTPRIAFTCIVFGYAFTLIVTNIPKACNKTAYNNCVATASFALGTALAVACGALVAGFSACIAGAVFAFLATPLCLASVAILLLILVAAAAAIYVLAVDACSPLCLSGSFGSSP